MLCLSLLLSLAANSMTAVINPKIDSNMWSISEELDKTELTKPVELRFVSHTMEDQEVKAGSELELRCEAIGVPTPIIMWTFNGQLLEGQYDTTIYEKMHNVAKPTIQHGDTASRIRIPCIDRQHKGRYKCIASNGHMTIEKTARISVVGSSVCQPSPQPPVIKMWTESRFENEGNSVQLLCRSQKGAVIAWYNEDRQLLNNMAGYEVAPTGDLIIKKAHWELMGGYTCVASNDVGEDRITSFFYPTALESESDSSKI